MVGAPTTRPTSSSSSRTAAGSSTASIASTISDVLWTDGSEPLRLRGNHGTFNTFDVMGVAPLLGRTPNASDAQPGATPVAVLGYRFWQRQFGGDPGVLGRQMLLNDVNRTVIGVMPKRFMWRGADVYLPTHFERGLVVEDVRTVHLLGRLKPGVTAAQAEADLTPIVADLKKREPTQFPDQWRVGLLPFTETFPSGIRGDVWILFAAVSLLLLIACANVSNLLLSRAASRQREMSVRVALGASRSRLVRQLLTESLLLALAAGVVGTGLAFAGLPAILALVPPDTIPDEAEIAVNTPVLLFTLAVSAVASVICGLAPALFGRKGDVATTMREASRSVAGTSTPGDAAEDARRRRSGALADAARRVRPAGSLVRRDAGRAVRRPAGTDSDRPCPTAVAAVSGRCEANRLLQLAARPARCVPWRHRRRPEHRAAPAGQHGGGGRRPGTPKITDAVVVHQVNAAYAPAAGLHLVTGRLLSDTDVRSAQMTAVVNERFVRTRLDGRNPLGQIVHVPRLKQPPFNAADDGLQIVGVVQDVRNVGLSEPVLPEIYLPFTVTGIADRLFIRTSGPAALLTRTVVNEVHAVDPNQPVDQARQLDVVLAEEEYATPRFSLALFLVFGVLGLTLSVVGVYGVMSTAVAQQSHEIGVRLALGAERGRIIRMIVGRGVRLLAIGVAVGLVASALAARVVAGQFWNVPDLRSAGVRGRVADPVRERLARVPVAGVARRTNRPHPGAPAQSSRRLIVRSSTLSTQESTMTCEAGRTTSLAPSADRPIARPPLMAPSAQFARPRDLHPPCAEHLANDSRLRGQIKSSKGDFQWLCGHGTS